MKIVKTKFRKLLHPTIFVVLLLLSFVFIQIGITRVSAQIFPVTVAVNHLDFGLVFPGEELSRTFEVLYSDDGNGVNYRIIQKIKPLPGAVVPVEYEGGTSDYCQDNPDDETRCYKNLCPYLEKISEEGEGDMEEDAFVGQEADLTDTWTIYFKVPAVFGSIAQDHIDGVVSETGEYGCDISIDVLLEPASFCGFKFFDIDQSREYYGDDYGLSGWTINLSEETACIIGDDCDNGWEVIDSVVTGEDGGYCFEILPGTYRVQEENQPDWIAIIPINPGYFEITIQEGLNFSHLDFGSFNPKLIN